MQPKGMVVDNIDELIEAGYGKKEAEKIVLGKDVKKKVVKNVKNEKYSNEVINLAMKKHGK